MCACHSRLSLLLLLAFAPALVCQAAPPPNDAFANRILLTGASTSTTGTNVEATKESGEPNHANNFGGSSVWWTWTAPSAGDVQIDTNASGFDTTLGVYTGAAVNALTLVAGDDDEGNGLNSLVTFAVVSGTTYQIAVDGYNAASGGITLNIALTIPPPPPANDNFASRITLTGLPASTTGTTLRGTGELGEPDHGIALPPSRASGTPGRHHNPAF